MRSSALACAQEDGGRVNGRDEPEQRIDKVDPDGALHADDAILFGGVFGRDEDLAEDTEERNPEDAVVI